MPVNQPPAKVPDAPGPSVEALYRWAKDVVFFLQTENVVIRQVVGQGGGNNLPELEDRVTTNETDIASIETQESEAIIASLSGRVSALEALVRELLADTPIKDNATPAAVEALLAETHVSRESEILQRLSAIEAQL